MTHFSETFGAEHRPIIEFAIENSQKLKLRATREALARGRQARTAAEGAGSNKAKMRESKTNDGAFEKNTASAGRSTNNSTEVPDGDQLGKRKRERKKKEKYRDQNAEAVVSGQETDLKSSPVNDKKRNKKRQKQEKNNFENKDFTNNSKKNSNIHLQTGVKTLGESQVSEKAKPQKSPQVSYFISILKSNCIIEKDIYIVGK